MVGAVIVADDTVIGEGFHRRYGEAHAEANAIAAVRDEALLCRSTLYVNLEPCSHYGKTPPCAELIIRKQIPRVVVACTDPNPKVAGRGIDLLRQAGVEVVTGVLEKEAMALNCFFMTAHRRRRPYIILKWAQSEDGFIDRHRKALSEKPVVFSTPLTRMMVHRLRSEVQAILVGTNTALMDNPSLAVRHWTGKSPVRILIDRHGRVPQDYHLLADGQPTFVFTQQAYCREAGRSLDGGQPALVFTQQEAISGKNACNWEESNVKYIKIDEDGSQLSEIIGFLYQNNIHSLLVEGGACLHRSFIAENLWDEIIIETAPVRLGDGVGAPDIQDNNDIQLLDKQLIMSGVSIGGRPNLITRYLNGSI
jgi:diaminohydroxyphosphoribosylaminopyrimidine deaminase/5-amino-6-(5-phosphoribosylamino)uracil reductase